MTHDDKGPESSPEKASASGTTPKDDSALGQMREKIDALDVQIQSLISERARTAVAVAKVKQAQQEALGAEAVDQVAYFRPEREADVLKRVIARNEGPLDDEEIARLFGKSCPVVSRWRNSSRLLTSGRREPLHSRLR